MSAEIIQPLYQFSRSANVISMSKDTTKDNIPRSKNYDHSTETSNKSTSISNSPIDEFSSQLAAMLSQGTTDNNHTSLNFSDVNMMQGNTYDGDMFDTKDNIPDYGILSDLILSLSKRNTGGRQSAEWSVTKANQTILPFTGDITHYLSQSQNLTTNVLFDHSTIQNLSTTGLLPNFDNAHIYLTSFNDSDDKQLDLLIHNSGANDVLPPWPDLPLTTKQKVLEMIQGPALRYAHYKRLGLTIYYAILLFVGIPGNGLTCLIILTNSYMRTAPNLFLLNLAFADLVTLTVGKTLISIGAFNVNISMF